MSKWKQKDEPKFLGGEDTAPNPVEVVLSTLIRYLGMVIAVVAKEKNIPFKGIERRCPVSDIIKNPVDLKITLI